MNPGGTRLIPEESYTESGEYTVSIDILGKALKDFVSCRLWDPQLHL